MSTYFKSHVRNLRTNTLTMSSGSPRFNVEADVQNICLYFCNTGTLCTAAVAWLLWGVVT